MLKRLWQKWKIIAEKIGNFQARVILTLIYFIFATPIGLVMRYFSDPLKLKRDSDSNWVHREQQKTTLEDAKRQF